MQATADPFADPFAPPAKAPAAPAPAAALSSAVLSEDLFSAAPAPMLGGMQVRPVFRWGHLLCIQYCQETEGSLGGLTCASSNHDRRTHSSSNSREASTSSRRAPGSRWAGSSSSRTHSHSMGSSSSRSPGCRPLGVFTTRQHLPRSCRPHLEPWGWVVQRQLLQGRASLLGRWVCMSDFAVFSVSGYGCGTLFNSKCMMCCVHCAGFYTLDLGQHTPEPCSDAHRVLQDQGSLCGSGCVLARHHGVNSYLILGGG